MKLTDEQRELYRTAFKGAYLGLRQFDEILSSEQAWKEEAELQEQECVKFANFLIDANNRLVDFQNQLNQAIEVLKWYANKENYKLQNADVYDAGGFAEYNVLGDDGNKARSALDEIKNPENP